MAYREIKMKYVSLEKLVDGVMTGIEWMVSWTSNNSFLWVLAVSLIGLSFSLSDGFVALVMWLGVALAITVFYRVMWKPLILMKYGKVHGENPYL